MKFKADEIASVLQKEIEDFKRAAGDQRGRAGPGSRRRHRALLRPLDGHGRRNGRVSQRRPRPRLQPRRKLASASSSWATIWRSPRGTRSKRPAACSRSPSGEALIGRVVDPARQSTGRQGADRHHRAAARRDDRPGRRRPPARQTAAADRHQGDRRDDPHRPRSARADHRRPQDRKDGRRHRHDHQSEGWRRDLHLRRLRPACQCHGRRRRSAPRARRARLHDRGQRHGVRSGSRCNTSLPTPVRRWPSTSCGRASTRW